MLSTHYRGDVLTPVTPMTDCLKEILRFARFWLLFYKMQCVGGWVDRRVSINREARDGEGVTEAGICGSQMVPCGECLPVILFANRSL